MGLIDTFRGVDLVSEKLSDGSTVFNVTTDDVVISCVDKKAAEKVWDMLTNEEIVVSIEPK